MSKTYNLPLYKELMEIFDNHEILNWRAKDFWVTMKFEQCYDIHKMRRQMYASLKILLICEYLKIDTSRSTKKIFIYSETPRLQELRNKLWN